MKFLKTLSKLYRKMQRECKLGIARAESDSIRFTTQKFCEVAPKGIPFIRQLQSKPTREHVVFRAGVAQENHGP